MRKRALYFVLFLAAANMLSAQEVKTWSLDDCINYALDKNIQLQQNKISLEESAIDVKTAKAALFPSLSFSTNQNVVNRPYQESSSMISGSEVISSNNKTTYNGNYGLNAQWTVWNGNKRSNNIKQQKLNQQMAGLTVNQTENSLQEQITQLYIQILYADESVKINESTLEVSKAQRDRGKELLTAGSLSKADLAQLESQVNSDQYQLVTAQASLQNYKLQLKQLLELDGEQDMALELPALSDEKVSNPLPDKTDIYYTALGLRPEIKSSKLSIQNADLNIAIAKSGYYPTISLNASSSTNNNSSSSFAFSSQLKSGWNNTVGFSLSLPIFNNRETKSAVEKARLQRNDSELSLINEQKALYKTIESLWLDANSARQQFEAADSKQTSSQTSFDMVSEQFNLGMKNIVELLTEKNNLLSAKQERIQAKYMAIMNRTLLQFYAGEKITL